MKSLSVTIKVKATEQYFSVVLFIMLYNVALSLWMNESCFLICFFFPFFGRDKELKEIRVGMEFSLTRYHTLINWKRKHMTIMS